MPHPVWLYNVLMIFLFAGTLEGKQAAKLLQNNGKDFLVFVTTSQGAALLLKEGISRNKIHCGPLDKMQIKKLIEQKESALLIDATHPYAVNISRTLISVSQELGLPLIRIERAELKRMNSKLIHSVPDVRSSAIKACELGQTIFLTIGSKSVGEFVEIALAKGKRIVTRVMPSRESIKKCLDVGFLKGNILIGYGPFSLDDNIRDFRDYHVDVIVTKDSGVEGGVQEKIDVAIELGIKVVLIQRPRNPYSNFSTQNVVIINGIADLKI